MRDPVRIDQLLDLLRQIWFHHPDLRFNQLIYVLQSDYSSKYDKDMEIREVSFSPTEGGLKKTTGRVAYDLFNLEDDKFIQFLRDYLKNLRLF